MADQQKQPAKSALNKTRQKYNNHVAFDDTPQDKLQKQQQPPAQQKIPPAKVTVLPPPTDFVLKDEVELLRQGYKNTHGEQVKTQGSAAGEGGGNQKTGGQEKNGGAVDF